MKIYQKQALKIVVATGAFLAIYLPSFSQVFEYRLKMADSLYTKKQYTQSLELYRQIFNERTYSPAMLLRMAYIEEGLGQNPMALYYINLYYELTHDETALNKMEDMATRYNLSGYDANRTDHIRALIAENKPAIIIALSSICVLLLSLMIYTLRRKKIKPYISFSFFILTSIFLVAFVNFDITPVNGITLNAPAFLMSGPSPAAKVVGVITEGHRLPIRGKHDVWVKVKWRDGIAYVKENQVIEVKL
ncbi:MAG TPA: SH3 domain-containing protein [Cyclobacteriaceae bacterium]|nr:SH3 domain-containing protein [Cyclobacteriaceae bacterium]